MAYSGAEILVKSLIYNKVKFIFGYPGGAVMPIYDSLFTYKKQIKHILTRHEQGSIHAAQGYARVTGKPGICLSTSGPGSTNIITGLADSIIDSTPLLCITGQVASNLLGTDAFQEVDIIDLSIPVTKWNFQITNPEQIFEVISKGLDIATNGRPGPVLIDITKDAQKKEIIFKPKKYLIIKRKSYLNYKLLQQVIQTIKQARKPIIIIGQGVKLAKAENQLKKFAERTKIPVASTLLGMGILKTKHYLNYGMLGMHGNYQTNILILKSDLIIAIGLRFDDRVIVNRKDFSKKTTTLIHIDIDNYEINKRIKTTIYLVGDLKKHLNYLIKNFKPNSPEKWRNWRKKFNLLKKVESKYVKDKDFIPTKIGITMPEVINYVNLYKKNNAILVTDVGQHQMSASRYFNFTTLNSQITSGGLGTMGFALPAALGAKIGAKRRQVICIVGDGGFQMTVQELGTIMQYEIPIKIIILNNNFLGMVKQWQDLFFNSRFSNTKISNPNFTKMAKAYNLKSKKVFIKEKLKPSIKKMLRHKYASLIEILVEKEYNTLPMIPTDKSVTKICL